ncbi:hypothetical protein L1987_29904 [Smallanthus sonchifolius]|uniref:Uncharacterized protein n=1 Tax=Smallanthus sonchifolius TaxID=185202 RepID=A0ACB9I0S1_9ASTR|nr:hypothetical protein L1987_29904 [Smallanthus sonchifolius]
MALIKPSVLILLLFATLMETLPSGLAEDQTPVIGLEPFPPGLLSLETIEQCWVSMQETVGCYTEVYRAFLSGQVGLSTVGPSCCMAINDITSNCWSQMYPDAPSFPSLLKNYCATYQTGEGDAPAPSIEPAGLI